MKIICIGQNYLDHIKELNSKIPTEPVFFMKPDTALLPPGKDFYLPDFSNNVQHEVELVLRICKEGKHIEEKFASRYYDKITLGIDITARDVQQRIKENGLPWEVSKSFDNSAPLGELVSLEDLKNKNGIDFELKINGKSVQQGNSNQMVFSFDKIISYLSHFVTLRKGDLIFTGTPKGVGAMKAGDRLEAFLEGNKVLKLAVK